MESFFNYIRESYDELLHKVTWPSWDSLLSTTTVVLIGTIILTILIFIMDVISSQLMDLIYGL